MKIRPTLIRRKSQNSRHEQPDEGTLVSCPKRVILDSKRWLRRSEMTARLEVADAWMLVNPPSETDLVRFETDISKMRARRSRKP